MVAHEYVLNKIFLKILNGLMMINGRVSIQPQLKKLKLCISLNRVMSEANQDERHTGPNKMIYI